MQGAPRTIRRTSAPPSRLRRGVSRSTKMPATITSGGQRRQLKKASNTPLTASPPPTFTPDPTSSVPSGPGPGEVGDFHAALAVDPITHDLLAADPSAIAWSGSNLYGTPAGGFNGSACADPPAPLPVDRRSRQFSRRTSTSSTRPAISPNSRGPRKRCGTRWAAKDKIQLTPGEQRPATVAATRSTAPSSLPGPGRRRENLSLTLHVFYSSNNALQALPLNAAYDSVAGLAIGSGTADHLYVVLDSGLYFGDVPTDSRVPAFRQPDPTGHSR